MEFSTSITDILKLHRSILTDLQKRLGGSQGSITLTTSGTSGASTLIGNSLNIPLYSGATTSWGSITGTLASQTDLNTALLAKVTGNSSITGATKTKITYDSKGLVTSGADATTADIADSLNKRYVTDAQQTIIGNTSGTNTGDNATNSQYSGLAASKQDTLVSGTNIKTINSTTLLGSGNITTGSVTSVGVSMPSAFNVASSPVTTSGTIAITGAGVVSQYVRGDGSLANFPMTSGGGSSVSYYLNGSVAQGTLGGVAFKEINKTPIIGAGTDFTISADGYIQSFITDANDPNQLLIPGGNWNFETYFSASSAGGSPSFYVELYKYDGTSLTLIASNSATPEYITGGTNIDLYITALAVPQTVLTLTDRLAIRFYVAHSGRTITLHTENSHLSQIITTFTSGLTALNGLTAQIQSLATGTTGTDFNISSATATHTFNLPDASASNRGALTSANWSTFNSKENALTFSSPLSRSTNTISIPAATVSVNGYLTSTDWATFNSKQGLLSITSLTNTGTDGITITNGTGAVIGPSPVTIDQQVANASQNGYLSKTDWAAFNGKGYGTVTSVTGTSPIASSGGATPNITILQSSGTINGYLSSTDWTTFNNKGTGTVTSVGGTGTVSGLSLSGSVTTTGNLTLGGTLSLTSGDVTTALGFTPYNATNPSGYTNNTGTVTSVSGTGTISGLTLTGTVTNSGSLTLGGTLSLTSLNVTTALGYTPYNATNPSGYTTNVGTVTSIATGTGLTGGTITGSGTISFSTAAVGTWAATPSSANLALAMTDETGSGSLVFGTSPTFTTSITVNGQTVSGYNTTPLQGAIKDGVTSILGDLKAWTTDYYQGTVLYSETSSTTITFGQLCYRTNVGEWGLADATSFAAASYYMLGICVKTTTGPSQPTSILINGFVESTYVADFKVGEPQYMAITAGSMSKSAPTASGNIVRIIGNTFWTTALQTNAKCVLHFNPDKTWIELT